MFFIDISLTFAASWMVHLTSEEMGKRQIRACLKGGGGPQAGEATWPATLHTILLPRNPGLRFPEDVGALANLT